MKNPLRENHDEFFMEKALEIARTQIGMTSPNPTVGAVIARGKSIVSIGYHRGKGSEHAEVMALKQAGELARGATMYVTLEPHSFYGTTPPCTRAIIESGIKRVVIAVKDPNPRVNGKGIEQLKRAGIEVVVGIKREEAISINEPYFKYHLQKSPWVTLKVALTLDGFIAESNGNSKWITGEKAREFVQELRAKHDAVLIGAGTLRKDNPSLLPRGYYKRRKFVRIILSKSFNILPNLQVVIDSRAETWFIVPKGAKIPDFLETCCQKEIGSSKVKLLVIHRIRESTGMGIDMGKGSNLPR